MRGPVLFGTARTVCPFCGGRGVEDVYQARFCNICQRKFNPRTLAIIVERKPPTAPIRR